MFALETVILPFKGGITNAVRAVVAGPEWSGAKPAVLDLHEVYFYAAHEVCARIKESHLEEREDPHGHPEPPSDHILYSFFVAVYPQHHHH